jgi:vancomycin permeability regulator SanA
LDKRSIKVKDKLVTRKKIFSLEVPGMCYRDKNDSPVKTGDVVERGNSKYLIKVIEEYDMATVAIVENIKTGKVETLLLRDIKKV